MRGGIRSARHRRPLVGLGIVLVACVALGGAGLGVEGKLDPFSLSVPGTTADDGDVLASSHFGNSSPFVVLLQGPPRALDRQGVALVRELRRDHEATVISAWDRGSVAGLRPSDRKALVLVDFRVPLANAMRDAVPRLDGILESRIHPPVEATQSGFATVSRALQDESLSATQQAELLAAPLLILVLLFVFRSVAAAAIPLVFGALTVFAGRGVLALLSSFMTIDALSLVVCTMMGLALGVDYSLLIVSRFREELDGDRDPWEAAATTRASAGRTTLFAGVTLIVAVVFSAFLQPGSLLLSLATTVGVVAAISVAVSTLAVPPLLALLGERINAGRIGVSKPGRQRPTIAAAATAALRKPSVAALLVAVPLVLLALPNIAFSTGAPGIQSCQPRIRPARTPRPSTAPSARDGGHPSSSWPRLNTVRLRRRRSWRCWHGGSVESARSPGCGRLSGQLQSPPGRHHYTHLERGSLRGVRATQPNSTTSARPLVERAGRLRSCGTAFPGGGGKWSVG